MGERDVALRRDTPRNRWWQLAGITAVAGLVAALAWGAYAWDDQGRHVNDFLRLPPQGGITMEVPEAGVYTLWASASGQGYSDLAPVDDIRELMVVSFTGPTDSDNPTTIEPEPFAGTAGYRVDGTRFGKAVWTVEFDEPGTYEVERRNLGVGSMGLNLGKGIGMPSRIMSGLVGIALVTVVLVAIFFVLGMLQNRRQVSQMLERFESFGQT